MTTLELPLPLGMPDSGAEAYPSALASQLTMANPKYAQVMVLPFPTGADVGAELAFVIPQDYAGSPALVIRAAIDGTPANTLALAAQQVAVDDAESLDVAYETEDTVSNATWTGYADEELIELTITLTPASAYQPGDVVFLHYYRDDSADNTTFDIAVVALAFRYSDT